MVVVIGVVEMLVVVVGRVVVLVVVVGQLAGTHVILTRIKPSMELLISNIVVLLGFTWHTEHEETAKLVASSYSCPDTSNF